MQDQSFQLLLNGIPYVVKASPFEFIIIQKRVSALVLMAVKNIFLLTMHQQAGTLLLEMKPQQYPTILKWQ